MKYEREKAEAERLLRLFGSVAAKVHIEELMDALRAPFPDYNFLSDTEEQLEVVKFIATQLLYWDRVNDQLKHLIRENDKHL